MTAMKLAETFRYLRDNLKNAGVASCELEAEWMIEHVLGMPTLERIQRPERTITGDEMQTLELILERRLSGEPLAYILEEKEFFGLKFKVTPDVLIPRPETELLVEQAFEWIKDHFVKGGSPELLELGVGSGCISVTLLHLIPELKVTALDISPGALKIAGENARRHNVADRLRLIEANAQFASRVLGGQVFDLVLANPPYVGATDPNVDDSVRRFEPEGAVFSPGEKGMDIPSQWVNELPNILKTNRSAAGFEFGYNQAGEMKSLFQYSGLFDKIEIIRDYADHERHIWGTTKWTP